MLFEKLKKCFDTCKHKPHTRPHPRCVCMLLLEWAPLGGLPTNLTDSWRRSLGRRPKNKKADLECDVSETPGGGVVGVWCGVVWCGVVWCGVVWCGVVWCGVVWCGWCGVLCCVVLCCVVLCGVVWCGVVWCGVVWCGVVWCGVVWCGVVWCGVVWCVVVWSPPAPSWWAPVPEPEARRTWKSTQIWREVQRTVPDADVKRPLASVSAIVDEGNVVVFGPPTRDVGAGRQGHV